MLVLIALALTSCRYEDVELKEVRKVKIDRLDKSGISFTATLAIVNPNGYRVKVTSTDADVYLDGRKAGKARLLKDVLIPADFDGEVEAVVRTDFEGGSLDLVPLIIGAAVKRSAKLRVEGVLRAKSFLIGRSFGFDYSHRATF